jgi:TPR repeat protein
MEAAEQGNSDAQYSVGLCHQTGDGGVTEDVNEANKWFSLAARQGHKGAIKVMSKQSKNI